MYSVPQHPNDVRRRQYDVPSAQSPMALSPGIQEVLHMLEAIDPKASDTKSSGQKQNT